MSHRHRNMGNGMALAKPGYRCVTVPIEQADQHMFNNAFMMGCASLMHGPTTDSMAGPNPRHWKTALECIDLGVKSFQEWNAPMNMTASQLQATERCQSDFIKSMCALGHIFYDGDFSADLMPMSSVHSSKQVINLAKCAVNPRWGVLPQLDESIWPWPKNCAIHLIEIKNRLWYEAFNPWDCDRSPAFVMLWFEIEAIQAYHGYSALSEAQQQDPFTKEIITLFYIIAIFTGSARQFTNFHEMRINTMEFQRVYICNEQLKNGRQHIMQSLSSFYTRVSSDPFKKLLARTNDMLEKLETLLPLTEGVEGESIQQSIKSLHQFRPFKYLYTPEDEFAWNDTILQAEFMAALFTGVPQEGTEAPPANVGSTSSSNDSNDGDPSSDDDQDEEGSPGSSPAKKARTAKRRQMAKAKKQREAEVKKQREADEAALREAKERAERVLKEELEQKAKEEAERKKEERKQRKAQERAAKKKAEQDARAAEKKRIEDEKRRLEEERAARARKAAEEHEAKARQEMEERRAKARREAQERRAKAEEIRIKARKDAEDNAKLRTAEETMLSVIANDPKKLSPQFMLKFMQIYAPSLVRFGRFEDEEGLDPLMGSCQYCFAEFNTTNTKPFYIKCCADKVCPTCMQDTILKPHPRHRLEFDSDDALVSQWVVMRRALGLPVPEY